MEALLALQLLHTPPEARFDRLVRTATRLFGLPIGFISLITEHELWFKSCMGLSASTVPRSETVCDVAIQQQRPLVIPDLALDPRFADFPVVREEGLRFYAGYPLRAPGGERVGTFCLLGREPRSFGPQDLATFEDLAQMVEGELADLEVVRLRAELDAARAELEEEHRRLRERELQFRKVCEAAFDVVVVSEAGTIVDVNAVAATKLGYGPTELIGRSALELAPPERRAGVRERILNSDERPYEAVAMRKDGSCFEVEVVGKGYVVDGRRLRVTALRDISERKRLERQKEQFIATVSHDLKNPLGAMSLSIDGLVEELLPKLRLEDELQDELAYWIGMAQKGVRRMLRLTTDLLDAERVENGQLVLEPSPCRSQEVFEEACWAVHGEADARKVKLEIAGEDLTFQADRDRLLQVLINLAGNAVKFSPAGGCVTFRADRDRDCVRLAVEDQGRGIPQDQLESIFSRYHQVEANDAKLLGGAGLGLSIARAIVTLHGGRIWAENRPEGGSRFVMTLPS